MAKLSLIQRVMSPRDSGAKKNLLKRDGITSDGINDDDSSSLSDRQEKGKVKSKKKFNARKFFRMGTRSADDEDGYESDASTGSTRSTSSSFLRYQNRAIWKSKFTKRSVLQRRRDGSEAPVEEEGTRPWPLFDRIYKRQNQMLKQGAIGEDGEVSDDEDDDSVTSDRSEGECPLAPPPPVFNIALDEDEEVVLDEENLGELGQPKHPVNEGESQGEGVFGRIRSLVGISSEVSREKGSKESHGERSGQGKLSPNRAKSNPDSSSTGELASDVETPEAESPGHSTTQESGIPTYEMPKAKAAPSTGTPLDPQARLSQSHFPTEKTNNEESSQTAAAKPTKPSRRKTTVSPDGENNIVPLSIPKTICYSLRSAIGDGSARQRNSHSLMERRPLRPNGCSVDTSYWSHRGKRNYMEDRFVIEHVGSTSKDEDSKPITLLTVFDGHGGSAASHFCSDWLSSYVRKKNEHFPGNMSRALETAFIKMDMDFVMSGQFDGTTACACAVVGKKVICCNAGDSRAIIVKRDGTAVPLSEDHKPDRDDETKRINDLGGRVIHWGRWRVEGVLAVSRSIGDAKLKPYVTADPDIVEHDIAEDDMFLVVASDGVWDTMSSDLVAKFCLVNTCRIVNKSLQVDERLLRWIARQISKRARENGSSDNISCIVANLNGKCT